MSLFDQDDAKALTRYSKTYLDIGEIYLFQDSVYRTMIYSQQNDTVLLGTTNAVIIDGKEWIKRTRLKKMELYPCPLALQSPAVQVFELDEILTDKSIEALIVYRKANLDLYKRYNLHDFYEDPRVYKVPQAQSDRFPDLKDKVYEIPVPFYCLGPKSFKKWFKKSIDFDGWPLIYVPSKYQ